MGRSTLFKQLPSVKGQLSLQLRTQNIIQCSDIATPYTKDIALLPFQTLLIVRH